MYTLNQEDTFIVLIAVQSIYWFILIPISLYYARKFWTLYCQQPNEPFFAKRHPKLVISSSITALIYPFAFRPTIDFLTILHILPELNTLSSVLLNTVSCFIMFICVRLWLLYFDYSNAKNSYALKWKQQILKQDTHIPWTTKYKFLGSIKFVSIIGAIASFIFITTIALSHQK